MAEKSRGSHVRALPSEANALRESPASRCSSPRAVSSSTWSGEYLARPPCQRPARLPRAQHALEGRLVEGGGAGVVVLLEQDLAELQERDVVVLQREGLGQALLGGLEVAKVCAAHAAVMQRVPIARARGQDLVVQLNGVGVPPQQGPASAGAGEPAGAIVARPHARQRTASAPLVWRC